MKCSFCNEKIKPGTGKMFVKNDGTIYYWCSSKCEKNYRLGRVGKKLSWVRKKK
jgi:large subunit ribosomal protein L24e